jgi:hypothetical protein
MNTTSQQKTLIARTRIVVAASAVAAALAGCNLNPSASPLPRPRTEISAGQAYARYTGYLAAHPQHARRGMTYGILVASPSTGYVCLDGYCHTWHGTVVVPGGRIEHLSSDQGDNGMAQFISPGDEFWFPAGGPVDAPSDDDGTPPVRLITAGAVARAPRFARP